MIPPSCLRWLGVVVAAASLMGTPAAAQQVKQASLPGGDLAYVEAGTGPPVLLVHGGMQDYRLWSAHLPALSADCHVIAYSRANHFPNAVSAMGMPDQAADLHGDDMAALVRALDLGPVDVIAHSSGAHAALFFAVKYPALVRVLVLNEPPASGLLTTPEDRAVAAAFLAEREGAMAALRAGELQAGTRLFADTVGGPGTFDRRPVAQQEMMLDNVLAHAADATSVRPRPVFTCEMAGRIKAPVLLTGGARSPDYFRRIAAILARCLPNVRRVTIDASHTVPGENRAAFDAAALAFLRDHPTP